MEVTYFKFSPRKKGDEILIHGTDDKSVVDELIALCKKEINSRTCRQLNDDFFLEVDIDVNKYSEISEELKQLLLPFQEMTVCINNPK